MQYQQIEIEVTEEVAGRVEDWLTEQELAFQQLDKTTLTPPPSGYVEFRVFVDPAETHRVADGLRAALPDIALTIRLQLRNEEEWRDQWKQFFHIRSVGRFVIVPSWEEVHYQKKTGEIPLHLDPGRAFGTGGHASTRLCLQMLSTWTAPVNNPSILDVGCGSGILAIGALQLWKGGHALAIDIDPEAVEVAVENAAKNQVQARIQIEAKPIQQVSGHFHWVLANLTGPTLQELAVSLCEKLTPKGFLLVSGILTTELPVILDTFQDQGLQVLKTLAEEEWSAATLTRP